jgi:SAM-dependent methyltransferase
MNQDTPSTSPLLTYYDEDHPWPEDPLFASLAADPVVANEIAGDIAFMCEFARVAEGPVLDICCGTGRLSVPMARLGRSVTGLDISQTLLARFAERLRSEPADVRERCRPVHGDARDYALDQTFALAVIGFNSLYMMPDQEGQRRALRTASRHLETGGRIIVDVFNPLLVPVQGVSTPTVVLSRQLPDRGISYTRWLVRRPMTASQSQLLEGWYDIVDAGGGLRREPYASTFRYIYKDELALLLELSGFEVENLFGSHSGAPWSPFAQKMIYVARKVREPLA